MSSIPLNGSTFHVLTLQEPLLLVIRTELHLSQVPPRIIIRSEYLRAYEDLLADGRSASRKYVVTGQPGIGKTGFAAFVLLKRLGERLTTVVQNREMEYILFDENGAWPQSCSANIPRIALPPTSWVLADSHSKSVYPDGLFWGNFNVVVVQTASPAQRRWREWLKEADAQFYIMHMDLWSISELTALMLLLESNVQDGLAIAIKYGRCARYVVEMTAAGHFAPNAVEKHEKDLSQAAIALARCRVTIPDQSDFGWRSEENYASSILFLRPEGYDRIHRARPVFFFSTEYVLGVLAKRLLQVSLKNKNRLFSALATRPSTSSAAGWIFENFVHAYFPVGPIILMDANGNAHRSIMTNTHILVGKVDDLQRKIQDREQKLPFYFRPTQSNFPGIDAVFVSSICVLAIQATVSSRHKKLNQGLEKVIDCLGIGRSRDQLKLIFVGPTMDKVSHLCRSITLEPMQGLAVPIYGCVLPLGLRHSDNAIQRNLEDAVTIPRSLEPDG